ncbi:uncharacterized protein BO80DRAFT_151131 [Aspergillus ibericus CBS 121593]|uniref:Uncharacterized protein n=1 Tax=Aspergillus ibericus CBS 121593 TaxID=1448316 RepID=A0A395GTZ1_9EURO|nr:hypothetical protein BO80DRAFT_151131 [Aspergillus ibericus CBS 121593]RAK98975.1 hypothetical protein BO80DRAFT_151131 [Aspergillus ibericus CBS 121593]
MITAAGLAAAPVAPHHSQPVLTATDWAGMAWRQTQDEAGGELIACYGRIQVPMYHIARCVEGWEVPVGRPCKLIPAMKPRRLDGTPSGVSRPRASSDISPHLTSSTGLSRRRKLSPSSQKQS